MDWLPRAEKRPAPAGSERVPAEGGDLYKAHDPRCGASRPDSTLDKTALPTSSSCRTAEPQIPIPTPTQTQSQQDQAAPFSYRALQRRSSPSPPISSSPPPPPASWIVPEGWSSPTAGKSSRTGSGAGSLSAPGVASGTNLFFSEPGSAPFCVDNTGSSLNTHQLAGSGGVSHPHPGGAGTHRNDHNLATSNHSPSQSGNFGSDVWQNRPGHCNSVEATSIPTLATCDSAPKQRAPSRLQTFFSSDEEEVGSPEAAGDRTALIRSEKGQGKTKKPKAQGKDGATETPNYSTFARPSASSGMEHKEKGSGQDGWSPSPYTSKTDMISNGSGATAAGKDDQGGGRTRQGNRFFVYMMACFATIGGLLFGYDTGIVSGSMLLIQPYFELSTVWQEVIVSGTIGAAAVFALIAGYVGDKLGRKMTIMIASFIFAAGAIIMAVSPNKETLLGGRIVVGVGIGFASMIVPVYVAEVAPTDIRGRLVTLNQLFITIGILISSIIAGAFSENTENGWRYMLGLAAAPGVIQFLGFFYLPESPRWLAMKGREEEARKVLKRIRGHDDVEDEMKEMRESEANKEEGVAVGKIFTTPHVRKALLIGCGLQLFQQLCGINTVIYYSATILKNAGFPPKKAIWLVCVPFSVNFLATFVGVWLVERLGRKLLLIVSFLGVTVALVVLGLGFLLSAKHSPTINRDVIVTYDNGTTVHDVCQTYSICEDCILNTDCGFCYNKQDSNSSTCLMVAEGRDDKDLYSKYWHCRKNGTKPDMKWSYGYCATDYTWMAVLGLALFVLSFAPGLGPMPWTINSEIYPMWARGTGVAISTMINWVFNLVVSFSFLSLLEAITKYGTFFLFCGICVLGMLFTAVFVPETKNKSLEEVEELFMTKEKREVARKQREARQDIVIPDPLDHSKIDTRF